MTVTSVPARFTSATPIGTRWSPSGTGPFSVASRLHSNETTGLSSRIALFSNPFASAGVAGRMILSPARCIHMEYGLWECCAASPMPPPVEQRYVTGKSAWPPNMYRILLAWLTTWSIATNENVTIRQFTIGLNPQPAAPSPMPVSTASEIGVKRTRDGPNSLIGSPVKSVAIVKTRGSRRISSATASSSAFWNVISRIAALLSCSVGVAQPVVARSADRGSVREHVDQQVLGIGERARLGEGDRVVQRGGDLGAHRRDVGRRR